jgi:hypothetical protein
MKGYWFKAWVLGFIFGSLSAIHFVSFVLAMGSGVMTPFVLA